LNQFQAKSPHIQALQKSKNQNQSDQKPLIPALSSTFVRDNSTDIKVVYFGSFNQYFAVMQQSRQQLERLT